MTPIAYINALPRLKRKAERQRLAKVAGTTLHAVRAWTELDHKSGQPRRRCQDAETCKRLEAATRSLVTVAEWNPAFAPLTTA